MQISSSDKQAAVDERDSNLVVCRQLIYNVSVASHAGREQRCHSVAVPFHGCAELQQHSHYLQTTRLRTVVQCRVACREREREKKNKSDGINIAIKSYKGGTLQKKVLVLSKKKVMSSLNQQYNVIWT